MELLFQSESFVDWAFILARFKAFLNAVGRAGPSPGLKARLSQWESDLFTRCFATLKTNHVVRDFCRVHQECPTYFEKVICLGTKTGGNRIPAKQPK